MTERCSHMARINDNNDRDFEKLLSLNRACHREKPNELVKNVQILEQCHSIHQIVMYTAYHYTGDKKLTAVDRIVCNQKKKENILSIYLDLSIQQHYI